MEMQDGRRGREDLVSERNVNISNTLRRPLDQQQEENQEKRVYVTCDVYVMFR